MAPVNPLGSQLCKQQGRSAERGVHVYAVRSAGAQRGQREDGGC